MIRLIFATNNQNKVSEMQVAIGTRIEVVSLKQAGIDIDIPEPFATLEENAVEKARVIFELTNENCFSEDTGLEVDELGGEPGVKSARYAGEDKSFGNNVDKLLSKLGSSFNRNARFRTIITLIWNGNRFNFEGICEGIILLQRKGDKGFGYDPVFQPLGSNKSFAEMDPEEKNQFSHRRKAADKLIEFLKDQEIPL